MRKNIFSVGIISLLVVTSCDSGYAPLDNAVYFGEAQTTNLKTITITNDGAKTDLYAMLTKVANEDVVVSVVSDAAVLDRYNSRNGSNYLLLPENFYKFGADELVIKAGQLTSEMLPVEVFPFDETLNVSEKYAIPVKIASSYGMEKLESASEIVLLCDKLIETQTYHTTGGLGPSGTVADSPSSADETIMLHQWTIEFLSYCELFGTNAHNFNIKGMTTQGIFCRYGELDHPKDELQVKVFNVPFYGIAKYEPKKWNHIAITCDGTIVKIYKNGVLDLTVDNPEPGKALEIASITLKQGNPGAMSEFRIWSVVRSQSEISHNIWAVNPKAEGLVHYWKMNDGPGSTTFKDAVENGLDLPIIKKNGTWKDQMFPPEQ